MPFDFNFENLKFPEESSALSVPDFSSLNCSGIYFLMRGDIVVYVGKAKLIRARVATHISEGTKLFDSVRIVPCKVESLDSLERKYIAKLLPEYNRCYLSEEMRAYERQGSSFSTSGRLNCRTLKKRYPRSNNKRTIRVLA